MNYLNDVELEQLYYATHIHEKFSDMMYKGYNLSYLVEQLGYFLNRPTILLNHRGEFIAHSHDFRQDTLKQLEKEIIDQIKLDLPSAQNGITLNPSSNKDKAITTFPVKTIRDQNSMLVIIDSSTIDYPSSQIVIEQAGNIISFTIIKEQAIHENTRQLKNNFLSDLVDQRIESEKEIIRRAKFHGLKEDMNNICITCTIDLNANEYESLYMYERKGGELHNPVYEKLEDEIVSLPINATLFTKVNYFIIILQFQEYTKVEMSSVYQFVKDAQKNIDIDYSVSFGISNPAKTLSAISTAYHESIEAILDGYDLEMEGFINFYKAREIEELLKILPKKRLKITLRKHIKITRIS